VAKHEKLKIGHLMILQCCLVRRRTGGGVLETLFLNYPLNLPWMALVDFEEWLSWEAAP
jgi:hypothetical protein